MAGPPDRGPSELPQHNPNPPVPVSRTNDHEIHAIHAIHAVHVLYKHADYEVGLSRPRPAGRDGPGTRLKALPAFPGRRDVRRYTLLSVLMKWKALLMVAYVDFFCASTNLSWKNLRASVSEMFGF